MKTETINLRTIRKIADKYGMVWHVQGGGWVINGLQAHYSYTADNAGEKAALVDYMANWGQLKMTDDDYNLVLVAQNQMRK